MMQRAHQRRDLAFQKLYARRRSALLERYPPRPAPIRAATPAGRAGDLGMTHGDEHGLVTRYRATVHDVPAPALDNLTDTTAR
jgi:hypothetical protein